MIAHSHETPRPPARVVVLGASGFVGGVLVDHLAKMDIEILGLSSADIDLCRSDAVDLLEIQLQEGDALVFVSALTPDRGKDIRTFMKNLEMGEHVCAALTNSACSHVVYVSSDAVYDDDANPVIESTPCNPSSFHGLMHLARERMLSATLSEAQVPLLILRPSLLYGARDTHNGYGPNRFLRVVLEGRSLSLFGEGEEKRDHVFIEDLSRLIELGLMHKSNGVLNVATGTSVGFMEVARVAAEKAGVDADIECLPRSQPISHRHFDVTSMHRAYPSFVYTALSEGLRKTVSQLSGPA